MNEETNMDTPDIVDRTRAAGALIDSYRPRHETPTSQRLNDAAGSALFAGGRLDHLTRCPRCELLSEPGDPCERGGVCTAPDDAC